MSCILPRRGLTFCYSNFCIGDFWTTACNRCPGELDKLDIVAKDPQNASINFVSICCDKLDAARNMIDKEESPRWSSMKHYFIEASEKERAKEWLGFRGVPFYIAIDKCGNICDRGGLATFDLHQAILLLEHSRFLVCEHSQVEWGNRGKEVGTAKKNGIGQSLPGGVGVQTERIFELHEEF